MVEWLEQLGYGAESRRIAWVRGSAAPFGDWKTLSVNTTENGYLFRIREGIRQRKERDGLRLLSAVPKIQWDSNPHCPYGYSLSLRLLLLIFANPGDLEMWPNHFSFLSWSYLLIFSWSGVFPIFHWPLEFFLQTSDLQTSESASYSKHLMRVLHGVRAQMEQNDKKNSLVERIIYVISMEFRIS